MLRTALSVLVLLAAGCKTSDAVTTPAPSDSTAGSAPESAVIRVFADAKGYTPSSITVQRGKPATMEFVRTSDDTCAKEVSFPDLGVNKPFRSTLRSALRSPRTPRRRTRSRAAWTCSRAS